MISDKKYSEIIPHKDSGGIIVIKNNDTDYDSHIKFVNKITKIYNKKTDLDCLWQNPCNKG